MRKLFTRDSSERPTELLRKISRVLSETSRKIPYTDLNALHEPQRFGYGRRKSEIRVSCQIKFFDPGISIPHIVPFALKLEAARNVGNPSATIIAAINA